MEGCAFPPQAAWESDPEVETESLFLSSRPCCLTPPRMGPLGAETSGRESPLLPFLHQDLYEVPDL